MIVAGGAVEHLALALRLALLSSERCLHFLEQLTKHSRLEGVLLQHFDHHPLQQHPFLVKRPLVQTFLDLDSRCIAL